MSAYSGSGAGARTEKNGSFLNKISSKISDFWADLTSDGSDDMRDVIGDDEFLEEEEFIDGFFEKHPAESGAEEPVAEEEPREASAGRNGGLYGKAGRQTAAEIQDEEEPDLSDEVEDEDEVDFEITPQMLRSDVQFAGTYAGRTAAAAQQPHASSIGYELPKNSAAPSSPAPQSGTTAPVGFNGKGAPGNHSATMIQFFEPHETRQADEICSVLKSGAIVIVNLQNVKEENDKLRIIDFVSGCCKGIDAKVQMVAAKSIFVAAPKGVELRKPVVPSEQTGEITGDGAGSAPLFSGFNFGVPGGERSTNSFIPRF